MIKPEIEEFAELLIKHVRDEAIENLDISLDPNARGVQAKRWQKKIHNGDIRGLANEIIPDCVDETIYWLLHAIEEGEIELSFKSRNGKMINLRTDGEGEMAGWYAGIEKWIAVYSKERYVDDFKDAE